MALIAFGAGFGTLLSKFIVDKYPKRYPSLSFQGVHFNPKWSRNCTGLLDALDSGNLHRLHHQALPRSLCWALQYHNSSDSQRNVPTQNHEPSHCSQLVNVFIGIGSCLYTGLQELQYLRQLRKNWNGMDHTLRIPTLFCCPSICPSRVQVPL